MWLLPIIRPLPGAAAGGPGDWIPVVVVVGVLLVAAAALVAIGDRGWRRPAHETRPQRHERAA